MFFNRSKSFQVKKARRSAMFKRAFQKTVTASAITAMLMGTAAPTISHAYVQPQIVQTVNGDYELKVPSGMRVDNLLGLLEEIPNAIPSTSDVIDEDSGAIYGGDTLVRRGMIATVQVDMTLVEVKLIFPDEKAYYTDSNGVMQTSINVTQGMTVSQLQEQVTQQILKGQTAVYPLIYDPQGVGGEPNPNGLVRSDMELYLHFADETSHTQILLNFPSTPPTPTPTPTTGDSSGDEGGNTGGEDNSTLPSYQPIKAPHGMTVHQALQKVDELNILNQSGALVVNRLDDDSFVDGDALVQMGYAVLVQLEGGQNIYIDFVFPHLKEYYSDKNINIPVTVGMKVSELHSYIRDSYLDGNISPGIMIKDTNGDMALYEETVTEGFTATVMYFLGGTTDLNLVFQTSSDIVTSPIEVSVDKKIMIIDNLVNHILEIVNTDRNVAEQITQDAIKVYNSTDTLIEESDYDKPIKKSDKVIVTIGDSEIDIDLKFTEYWTYYNGDKMTVKSIKDMYKRDGLDASIVLISNTQETVADDVIFDRKIHAIGVEKAWEYPTRVWELSMEIGSTTTVKNVKDNILAWYGFDDVTITDLTDSSDVTSQDELVIDIDKHLITVKIVDPRQSEPDIFTLYLNSIDDGADNDTPTIPIDHPDLEVLVPLGISQVGGLKNQLEQSHLLVTIEDKNGHILADTDLLQDGLVATLNGVKKDIILELDFSAPTTVQQLKGFPPVAASTVVVKDLNNLDVTGVEQIQGGFKIIINGVMFIAKVTPTTGGGDTTTPPTTDPVITALDAVNNATTNLEMKTAIEDMALGLNLTGYVTLLSSRDVDTVLEFIINHKGVGYADINAVQQALNNAIASLTLPPTGGDTTTPPTDGGTGSDTGGTLPTTTPSPTPVPSPVDPTPTEQVKEEPVKEEPKQETKKPEPTKKELDSFIVTVNKKQREELKGTLDKQKTVSQVATISLKNQADLKDGIAKLKEGEQLAKSKVILVLGTTSAVAERYSDLKSNKNAVKVTKKVMNKLYGKTEDSYLTEYLIDIAKKDKKFANEVLKALKVDVDNNKVKTKLSKSYYNKLSKAVKKVK
ncbi:hypothetical protein SM124_01510 [Bacillus sp. 31A1R]|uniref:Uncharacterized protein n=1 Tax=Robertmurraya mangrovi TaxID=3098077 RepID=A0ABU5ITE0_9BACI|nr:hypothetical protein [Bacillus sp. 31A1R]MDZ5470414.1 hypothetical protein [Bacillus sp. 31A1R]